MRGRLRESELVEAPPHPRRVLVSRCAVWPSPRKRGEVRRALQPYSPNTKIIVAFFAKSFISGALTNLPTWLRVRPVAMAMYCLPSTA